MSATKYRHGEWDKEFQRYEDGSPSHKCTNDDCALFQVEWRRIPDFPSYEMNEAGGVRNIYTYLHSTPLGTSTKRPTMFLWRGSKVHEVSVANLRRQTWKK